MPLEIPPLPAGQPIADKNGLPSLAFTVYWQQTINSIAGAINAVAAAQAAADAANTAAATANAAAVTADAAATAAQDTADQVTAASSLSGSYVSGVTISAHDAGTDATISITAHTRHYPQPDGTTVDVAVSAGSITGKAYSTFYYIYYDDPTRAGGAVTYLATTDETVAAQIGDRHTVGSVTTPAALAADTGGKYVKPAGSGQVAL